MASVKLSRKEGHPDSEKILNSMGPGSSERRLWIRDRDGIRQDFGDVVEGTGPSSSINFSHQGMNFHLPQLPLGEVLRVMGHVKDVVIEDFPPGRYDVEISGAGAGYGTTPYGSGGDGGRFKQIIELEHETRVVYGIGGNGGEHTDPAGGGGSFITFWDKVDKEFVHKIYCGGGGTLMDADDSYGAGGGYNGKSWPFLSHMNGSLWGHGGSGEFNDPSLLINGGLPPTSNLDPDSEGHCDQLIGGYSMVKGHDPSAITPPIPSPHGGWSHYEKNSVLTCPPGDILNTGGGSKGGSSWRLEGEEQGEYMHPLEQVTQGEDGFLIITRV